MSDTSERLIFALDVTTVKEAQEWVLKLEGLVSFFKIGLELQLSAGTHFIDWLIQQEKKVFLDYKYFDVETTVRRAVAHVAGLGAHFLTIHGNRSIVEAAVAGRGQHPLKLLAVTVLTSFDTLDIQEMGFPCTTEALVLHRGQRAFEAGCDGVVASAREAKALRNLAKKTALIVIPGIRPEGTKSTEHKRSATPTEAIVAGADYLVVGRPIRDAVNPQFIAEKILSEMALAFRASKL